MTDLILQNLIVRYPGAGRAAIENVSFRAAAGEVTALIGPNGSGKSTLIRTASGRLAPVSGTAMAAGMKAPLHTLPPHERARLVSVVPQEPSVSASLPVYEAAMLGRLPFHGWFGPESREDTRVVEGALRAVGLADKRDMRMEQLSGGERQRVLIARSLAQEAPILLLDEPTAHLDIHYQADVMQLLRFLAATLRSTILLAMHDINLASRFADRILLLEDSHLIADGTPSQVLTEELLSRTYTVPMIVFPHPETGHPLVFLDGYQPGTPTVEEA